MLESETIPHILSFQRISQTLFLNRLAFGRCVCITEGSGFHRTEVLVLDKDTVVGSVAGSVRAVHGTSPTVRCCCSFYHSEDPILS